jgi:hypothetical protein
MLRFVKVAIGDLRYYGESNRRKGGKCGGSERSVISRFTST